MAKAIKTSGNYLVIETKQGKLRIIDGAKKVPKTASRLAAFALKSDAERFAAKDNCPLDDPRQRATILAGLRYWQQMLERVGGMTPNELELVQHIAQDGGIHKPLTPAEIDTLCQTINP